MPGPAIRSAVVLPLALVAAVALGAAGAPLAAQARAAAPFAEGDRVRLDLGRRKETFEVVGLAADTLVVRREGFAEPRRIPLAAIERAERSEGRRSAGQGFLRGAGWGLAGGAVLGAVAGYAGGDDDPSPASWVTFSAESKAAMGAIVFGGIGGIVGGVFGAARPGERWTRVELAPRVSVLPMRRGVGVRVGL